MRVQLLKFVIGVIASCLFIISCSDTDKEKVKFKVISAIGGFTGTYSLDAKKEVSFISGGIGNNVYYFENTVEIDDQLEISASPATTDTTGDDALTSMEIKVYVENSLIKNISDTSIPIEKISLIYEKGESTTETTD